MNPALEYLIHSGIIKEWFSLPCSIFLQKKETWDKLVVTITNEFKPSDKYSVKHWNITDCNNQQGLPSMIEYCVPKKEINRHPAIVVPGCRLIHYEQESINSDHNSPKSPMSVELYRYFFDNCLPSNKHQIKRLNWLWTRFIHIYMPSLISVMNNSNNCYISEFEIAENQRNIVNRFMKKEWQIWLKWQKYMLLSPAEIIFYKEYLLNN